MNSLTELPTGNISNRILIIVSICFFGCFIFIVGCNKLQPMTKTNSLKEKSLELSFAQKEQKENSALKNISEFPPNFEQLYYEQFYQKVTNRWNLLKGTNNLSDLDSFPKDPYGMINWTGAALSQYIHPLWSLDFSKEEDDPLMLNVFIEAKTPLMFNVVFPHYIHTYWLNCETCHPAIFIDKAGANPILMEEIFQGKWCGRCHNKVAFPFWPKSNCNRCHVVPKGMSLQLEKF